MDKATTRVIATYLDEIADLARGVEPAKLVEIKARAELIKRAVETETMVDATQDPDTGTGQQLADYLPYWDKPDEALEADGHSLVAIHAVKAGLASKGLHLKYPAPEAGAPGFHDLGQGGIPANWEELVRQGKLG